MQFTLDTTALPHEIAADALLVASPKNENFSATLLALDKTSNGFFSQLKKDKQWPEIGTCESFSQVPGIAAKRVIIAAYEDSHAALSSVAEQLWQTIEKRNWHHVAVDFSAVEGERLCQRFISALGDYAYRFDTYLTTLEVNQKAKQLRENFKLYWLVESNVIESVTEELNWAKAFLEGSYLTRDLGNQPANVCTPSYLADQAQILAQEPNFSAKILDKKAITELKMGALLGVAQGSVQEPRFIILEYKPQATINKQPIVLVGKGVTFDAGGISLKPPAGMDFMKYDMGGAATVMGTLKAISQLALNVHVIGLIPATENLPDGAAIKPGDIVASMSGKTIEVINTDAEGRLILCDALTYAERFQPQAVIDIATLTGAVIVALGNIRAAVMGNDEALQNALYEAGEVAHDRLWKLPLDSEYLEMMRSHFADLWNTSGVRDAGSSTAGAFLSEFTHNYKWAHLDIAGVAWREKGARKGSTGRPVGMLLEYFTKIAAQK